MSPVQAVRATALRQARLVFRRRQFRHASTATETTSKAKHATNNAISKASEGLSRVTSSAGPAMKGAASSARNALSRIGGRTGRLISFVESLIPPTVYYSRVGIEMARIIAREQKMTLPSGAHFSESFQPYLKAMRNPSSTNFSALFGGVSPESMVRSTRSISREQLTTVAVVAAQTLGFFTVGTMLGKMKVVGYRGEVHHEH